jgi:hypothetical protein
MKPIDLTGMIFGRLHVVKRAENHGGRTAWVCTCECGEQAIVMTKLLQNGRTTSCGCRRREVASATLIAAMTIHGQTDTYAYQCWRSMKLRCYTKTSTGYENYGGRGIKVCDRWRDSFEAFIADMGQPPSEKHTIERCDVNGDYTPSNCCWATKIEQGNNKRNNDLLEFNGRKQTRAEWAREFDINYETLSWRLANGWPVSKALTVHPGAHQ